MDVDAAASQLAARQHNLVTRAQAHGLGITDDMIDRRLRTRRWSRIRRAVYAVGGMAPTFEQGVMAAVLTGGPTAMASHATAAMLWNLPVEQAERIEITTITMRQVRIEGVIGLDLAYPELRIGIELDGFDTHRTRTAFDDDRDRNNDLTLAGWVILHLRRTRTARTSLAPLTAPSRVCADASYSGDDRPDEGVRR